MKKLSVLILSALLIVCTMEVISDITSTGVLAPIMILSVVGLIKSSR